VENTLLLYIDECSVARKNFMRIKKIFRIKIIVAVLIKKSIWYSEEKMIPG